MLCILVVGLRERRLSPRALHAFSVGAAGRDLATDRAQRVERRTRPIIVRIALLNRTPHQRMPMEPSPPPRRAAR
jgi:hypothetical protein